MNSWWEGHDDKERESKTRKELAREKKEVA